MADTQQQERMKKIEVLQQAGLSPWGGRFAEAAHVKDLLGRFPALPPGTEPNQAETYGEVRAAGRIVLLRNFGNLIFMHLQDQSGRMQIGITKQHMPDDQLKLARKVLDLGDLIGVEGVLGRTKKGEPTLWARSWTMLTKSLLPLPEKHHGLTDPELCARRRYLDMIANEESLRRFLARSRMVSLLRRYLDGLGFVEVETPILQAIPGGAAARPFVTHHNALDMKLYMRIATEVHLKKLMVGGIEKVYEIGRIFRNEGIDTRHNPEFTTVELYQAYGDLSDMMAIVEGAISGLAKDISGDTKVTFGGKTLDLTPPWPRRKYLDLLREHAGVSADDVAGMQERLKSKGVDGSRMPRVDLIDSVFSEYVEPHLQDAVFVVDQPVEMSPLCRARKDAPELAERFEAFVASMEMANAYTELNDPIEQRRRLEGQAAELAEAIRKDPRQAAGREAEALVDEDFLMALDHGMPPAGGMGMGIDRLAMVLLDAPSIRDVILFPLLRPEGGAKAAVIP